MWKSRSAMILAAFAASHMLCASAAAASDAGNAAPSALTSVRMVHSARRVTMAPTVAPRPICEESDAENVSNLQDLVLGVTY
jgi:hypothetical protein